MLPEYNPFRLRSCGTLEVNIGMCEIRLYCGASRNMEEVDCVYKDE